MPLIAPALARCPYCRARLERRYGRTWLEPCEQCRRPLLMVRAPAAPALNGIMSLLSAGAGAYGIAMVLLMSAWYAAGLTLLVVLRCLVPLYFLIGSILVVDGVLAIRTRIDRPFRTLHVGIRAVLSGFVKVTIGITALFMVGAGLSIIV